MRRNDQRVLRDRRPLACRCYPSKMSTVPMLGRFRDVLRPNRASAANEGQITCGVAVVHCLRRRRRLHFVRSGERLRNSAFRRHRRNNDCSRCSRALDPGLPAKRALRPALTEQMNDASSEEEKLSSVTNRIGRALSCLDVRNCCYLSGRVHTSGLCRETVGNPTI